MLYKWTVDGNDSYNTIPIARSISGRNSSGTDDGGKLYQLPEGYTVRGDATDKSVNIYSSDGHFCFLSDEPGPVISPMGGCDANRQIALTPKTEAAPMAIPGVDARDLPSVTRAIAHMRALCAVAWNTPDPSPVLDITPELLGRGTMSQYSDIQHTRYGIMIALPCWNIDSGIAPAVGVYMAAVCTPESSYYGEKARASTVERAIIALYHNIASIQFREDRQREHAIRIARFEGVGVQYSVTECAERAGIQDRAIRLAIKEGRLRAQKVGWSWAVEAQDLEDFMDQDRRPGPKKRAEEA
jgi:excisionase family DNA binding protein